MAEEEEHACRRVLRHAAAGYSELCDIFGYHRLQVIVCCGLDNEPLARAVALEELGHVEEQQYDVQHLGVGRARDGQRHEPRESAPEGPEGSGSSRGARGVRRARGELWRRQDLAL